MGYINMFYNIQLNVPAIGAAEVLKAIFPSHVREINAINFMDYNYFTLHTRGLGRFREWISEFPTDLPLRPTMREDGIKRLQRRKHLQSGLYVGIFRVYTFQPKHDDDYMLGLHFNVQLPEGVIHFNGSGSKFVLDLRTGLWNVGIVANGKALIRSNDIPLGVDAEEFVTDPLRRPDYNQQLAMALLPEVKFNTPYIEDDITEMARFHCKRTGVISEDDLDFLTSEAKFLVGGDHYELSF